jgi:hypothetical protein
LVLVVVVVTTDGSDERALVPEYGRGVHLEEMGELGKTGRSRNAHRVAVGRRDACAAVFQSGINAVRDEME